MAEIVPVVSEALEAQIRDLLPSQRGFGEDLQASNVIFPTIDLTAAAQGTTTPISMQQAIAFGSQTAFNVANATTALINTPGFYKVFGTASIAITAATGRSLNFSMTDGLSTKNVWGMTGLASVDAYPQVQFDFIVFIAAGITLNAVSDNSFATLQGSTRQIADVNGVLTNPVGYTPQ